MALEKGQKDPILVREINVEDYIITFKQQFL